ncbi:hypothetical protein B0H21DRAFT_826005 [Amylocystis lapponica]|nr:hypothetical protein B0H21DRAFT_826005 [Amylocystis lapponica]
MGDSMKAVTTPLLSESDPEQVFDTILAIYENERIQSGNPLDPLGGKHLQSMYAQPFPVTSAFMTWAKADMICDWCGWRGHLKGDCFCEGGGKEGRQPATWKGKPQPKHSSPAARAAEARARSATATQTNPSVNMAQAYLALDYGLKEAHTSTSGGAEYDYSIFLAGIDPAAVDGAGNPSSWTFRAYADSGATHHYFTEHAHFTEYLPLTPTMGQAAKKGSEFQIVGVGNISIQVEIDGRKSVVVFQNTMHAPDLAANLLSMSQMDR